MYGRRRFAWDVVLEKMNPLAVGGGRLGLAYAGLAAAERNYRGRQAAVAMGGRLLVTGGGTVTVCGSIAAAATPTKSDERIASFMIWKL